MAIKKITKSSESLDAKKRHDEILIEIEKREASGEKLGSVSKDVYNSPVDQFKWGICKEIMSLKVRENLTSKKMAELMQVDKSKASQILNCRVESFSVERLLNCFFKLKNIEPVTDKKIEEVFNLFGSDREAS